MKKLTILCLLIAMYTVATAQSFTVKATIAGLADGTPMQLMNGCMHEESKPISEQKVQNGVVNFTINEGEPRMYILMVKDAYGAIHFMAEDGNKIEITATAKDVTTDSYKNYNYENLKITGSPLTEIYNQKVPNRERLNSLYEAVYAKHADISKKMGEARKNKDTKLYQELNDSEEGKAFAKDEKDFFDEVERVITKAILDNKDTFWGALFMMDQFTYLTEEQKPLYDQLSDTAKKSYYGVMVGNEIVPPSKAGVQMPDFTATNWDNNTKTTFRELCKGKKVVLLDFWASWCSPCRKEIPNIKEQYELYKAKGFEVVSISADKKDADWKKALVEEKLAWPNYRDADKSIQQAYKVKFYPTIYVLDGEGKCIAENVRGEELAKLLAELFK